MEFTTAQIRGMAQALGLEIPDGDLDSIALRLSALLTAMEEIETELGEEMDATEPIPPVNPHEPAD